MYGLVNHGVVTKHQLCLYVRLYTITVKTAAPIVPKFCVRPRVTPLKVYE